MIKSPSLLLPHRASNMTGCVEQLEAPEEVDRIQLKCLQRWTEKRLDSITSSEPDKDRDLYRLHCKTDECPIMLSGTLFWTLFKKKHWYC